MNELKNGTLNVKSCTIFCHDNLEVLQGINSGCIDLIYLDPPFNKNKVFAAPMGSTAQGADFKDIFREKDLKDEWLKTIEKNNVELYNFLNGIKNISRNKYYLYNYCYLAYMAIRLIEIHRVLKDSGSVYFHCDPTMSHYIKLLMDVIFGEKNFRNEIVWCYKSGGASKKQFAKKHDIILLYTKSAHFLFKVIKDKSYISGKFGFKETQHLLNKDEKGWFTEINARDYWLIDMVGRTSKERTGYPTQKPLKLLKRIIRASSDEANVVLDPFCGCATSSIAAEILGRKWIGVDISHKAFTLVQKRLKKEIYTSDLETKIRTKPELKTNPPKRTDLGEDYVDSTIK